MDLCFIVTNNHLQIPPRCFKCFSRESKTPASVRASEFLPFLVAVKSTNTQINHVMKTHLQKYGLALLTASVALGLTSCATAQPAATASNGGKKPNVVILM